MSEKTAEHDVVGIQYRITPSSFHFLERHLEGGPLVCKLEREPDNTADENAIRVILNETPMKGLHLGYLRRQVSEMYAPLMDAGKLTPLEVKLTEVREEKGGTREGTVFFRFRLGKPKAKVKKPRK